MIYFVVTEKGSFSIRNYVADQGHALADRMRVVLYRELAGALRVPRGTWVFTELDQLDPPRRQLADLTASRLAESGDGVRVMNDPSRVRLRLDLLRAAHAAGANEHRAWAAADITFDVNGARRHADSRRVRADSLRYPVFVRFANEHSGNQTPLLDTPGALATALASLVAGGAHRQDLLVVEFCDTRDDKGLYRKYSAYNVGGRILPRTIECSREWMVKWSGRVLDRARADDQIRYVETNPHGTWLTEMFRLANIDYGRIDYGVQRDGTPRLWEINTNPTIGGGQRQHREPEIVAYRNMVAPARAAFYEAFQAAWAAVDSPAIDAYDVPLEVPETLQRAVADGLKRRRSAERVNAVVNAVVRQAWVRPVSRVVKRVLEPLMVARMRD